MKAVDGREQDYEEWRNNNSDPYGRAIFTYAERWAEMLESLIDKDSDVEKVIAENAEKTSREADTEGITGFMYGRSGRHFSFSLEIWRIFKKVAQQQIQP